VVGQMFPSEGSDLEVKLDHECSVQALELFQMRSSC
jgi:hypothetical protein